MFNSAFVKVSFTYLSVLTLVLISGDLHAQQGTSSGKQIKIKISRTEDGSTSAFDRVQPVKGPVEIPQILRRYGVIEEMQELADGEAIEIIIRKKRRVGEEEQIKVELESLEAIPSENVPAVAEKAEKVEAGMMDGPFLGVKFEDLGTSHPMMLEIPEIRGVMVTDVIANTSAAESGLEHGDVIAAVNDEHLDEGTSIIDIIGGYEAGDEVELIYYRNTKKKKARVVLGARGQHQIYSYNFKHEEGGLEVSSPVVEDEQELAQLEESLEETYAEQIERTASAPPPPPPSPADLPPMERAFLGVNGRAGNDAEGALVGSTLGNSTAAELGLQEGDLIVSLNGAPISKFEDLNMVMEFISPGDFITVEFIREEETRQASAIIKNKRDTYKVPVYNEEAMEEEKQKAQHVLEQGDSPQSSEAEPMWEVYREIVASIRVEEVSPGEAESISRRTGYEISAQNSLRVLDLSMYPNPNEGMFKLVFELPDKGDTEIRFLNMEGKLIYAQDLPGFTGKYEKDLDFSDKERGIYFLRIVQNGRPMLKKIVLQ